jgi:hypothetical protein
MTEPAVYLYAFTQPPPSLESARLQAVNGVSGAPVRTVEHAGLTAVVSSVPLGEYAEHALHDNLEDLDWLEQTARAHHAVVELVAHLAATAPVRLVTLFHDDQRVRQLIDQRRDDIEKALSRIADRSEWGVKAYSTPVTGHPPPTEPMGPTGSADGALRPGTAYLQRRGSQRRHRENTARRLADRAEEIHGTLGTYAVAGRRHRPQDPRLSRHEGVMVLNTTYLVDDHNSTAFLTAAERLGTRVEGIHVEVTGPWPAYSFSVLGEDPANP